MCDGWVGGQHDMAGLVAGFDSFAWKRWVPAFWKCAYFASPKAAGTGYFIASDNHRAKTEADAFFGTNQSSWYSQEITRGHVRGHVTALIDVLVLSMCDHLVTTSMSTFGYIAAGLASLPPSIVNFDGSCLKDMTSQPCFHKWSYLFTAKCYDKHQMVSPEVRVCGFYRVPDASDDTF
ncbi:hypothetical protein T484DRAFT_3047465 [Baffinella frigidus]|nr:hypothetical protein T484DRAFT_3047465 [Cryptophyta sp. CCMP2293]